MRRTALLLVVVVSLVMMAGCGIKSLIDTIQGDGSNPAVVPVSLTVTDTPPAGVTVLFSQLSITGAALSPGSVSILNSSNAIPVNVSQLQTDSAFLGSANVAVGTYTSLSLALANPQLTIYNGSGAAIGSGANACANNSVCQLTPSVTPLNLTFSSAPFPVNVTANSPLAFKLDIHLDTIIQPDLTVNLGATNGVTISQLPTPPTGTLVTPLGNLTGGIQSLISNGFTLQTGDGRPFSIGVNSSTTYSYPSSVCTAGNSSCLGAGQIVRAKVSLQTGGTLLASAVDYLQPVGQTVAEGSIIRLSTSGGNTLVDMILQKGSPTPTPNTLPFGQRVTVTIPPTGVTYSVDSDSFTIPSGLSFASASDLIVGQQVSLVVQGSVTTASGSSSSSPIVGTSAITFTAKSITLEPSQITGSVAAINASALSFTLSTLPNYLINSAVTAGAPPTSAPFNITVQTIPGASFANFTPDNISGLAVNNVVSVGGWFFSTPSGVTKITQVAKAVIGRPGPTPLF